MVVMRAMQQQPWQIPCYFAAGWCPLVGAGFLVFKGSIPSGLRNSSLTHIGSLYILGFLNSLAYGQDSILMKLGHNGQYAGQGGEVQRGT